MSTAYRPLTPISFETLRAAMLEPGCPVRECQHKDTTETSICLSADDRNYVWAFTGDGSDVSFERYGLNNPTLVLDWVARRFDVEMIDEYDDRFLEDDGD